jgi:hypothetical protein
VVPETIEQRLRLQQTAASLRVERYRVRSSSDGRFVAPDKEFRSDLGSDSIAKLDHLAELETCIDVKKWKRNRSWIERLLRQP